MRAQPVIKPRGLGTDLIRIDDLRVDGRINRLGESPCTHLIEVSRVEATVVGNVGHGVREILMVENHAISRLLEGLRLHTFGSWNHGGATAGKSVDVSLVDGIPGALCQVRVREDRSRSLTKNRIRRNRIVVDDIT